MTGQGGLTDTERTALIETWRFDLLDSAIAVVDQIVAACEQGRADLAANVELELVGLPQCEYPANWCGTTERPTCRWHRLRAVLAADTTPATGDHRGRTPDCLPFCQGGLHDSECPVAADTTPRACEHRFPDGSPCRLSDEAHAMPGMGHHAPAAADTTPRGDQP